VRHCPAKQSETLLTFFFETESHKETPSPCGAGSRPPTGSSRGTQVPKDPSLRSGRQKSEGSGSQSLHVFPRHASAEGPPSLRSGEQKGGF
jgi:hypothetical protein